LKTHNKEIVEAIITHTRLRNTRHDVNMTDIEPRVEQVGYRPVGSQAGPKSWRLLRGKIVNRKGNLPELEVRGINVTETMGLFLLDQFFEDADVVGLRNLDSEHLILSITDNEAVE
jgi:hypothetical protein